MTITTAIPKPTLLAETTTDTQAPQPPRWVPWLFQVGNLCFWLSLYFYVPTLPNYARDLGAPLTIVGTMLSAYGVVQLLFRIPTGVASDWWGRQIGRAHV